MLNRKMLLTRCWMKSIHTCKAYFSTIDKSLLFRLRKSTGYGILNCKKALEISNNNMVDAEKWLKETAKKEGWAKAMKLKERIAQQGLIGIHICDNTASIVEVSCETDFVARNNYFQGLVTTIAKAVNSSILVQIPQTESYSIIKKSIMVSELSNLECNDGKVFDAVAVAIHQLGENIVLRRAMTVIAGEGISLSAYCHPAVEEQALRPQCPLYGKHGAIVAFKQDPPKSIVGLQLCLQVIGTKPTHIGKEEDEDSYNNKIEPAHVGKEKDDISYNTDEEKAIGVKPTSMSNEDDNEDDNDYSKMDEEQPALLHQEFLFNSFMTVREFLAEEEAKVIDFVRFSCGEISNSNT